MIEVLTDLKDRNMIDKNMHKKLNPTTDPRFYNLPKVHKTNMPLPLIVSSIGTITYEYASYLAKVLFTLVGKTEHHVKNSNKFMKGVREIKMDTDNKRHSYHAFMLLTSMLNYKFKVLQVIRRTMRRITSGERTPLAPDVSVLIVPTFCSRESTITMELPWDHPCCPLCATCI